MSLKDDICRHDAPINAAPASNSGAALVHHADPSGVSQPNKVGMMLECSTGELFAMAAFMHHNDQGHQCINALCRSQRIKG